MEMKVKENDIRSSGVQSTSNFKIQTGAIAFNILSSKLYSDKIMAVIRELSCNAHDAHVDRYGPNYETNFNVHLPTILEPYFEVEDFGIGLEYDEEKGIDQVSTLYATYFSSTKRKSNEVIGGFGVGSKAPFAYTNGFTIMSCWKGVLRTYDAYLKDGEPSISLLTSVPTDRPNGVTVKFDVLSKDMKEFQEKAIDFFSVWDNPPVVSGLGDKKIEKYTEVKNLDPYPPENPLSDFHFTYTSINRNEYKVIMGNVPYDVSSICAGEVLNNYRDSSGIMYLKVPIGTFKPAVSREYLSFEGGAEDEKEVINLFKDRLLRWNQLKQSELKTRISKLDAKTPWALADRNLNKDKGEQTINFHRDTFIHYLNSYDTDLYNYLRSTGTVALPESFQFSDSFKTLKRSWHDQDFTRLTWEQFRGARLSHTSICEHSHTIMFVNDLGHSNNTNTRMRYWLREKTSTLGRNITEPVYLFSDSQAYEELAQELGFKDDKTITVVNLSDIVLPKNSPLVCKRIKNIQNWGGTRVSIDLLDGKKHFYFETYHDDIVFKIPRIAGDLRDICITRSNKENILSFLRKYHPEFRKEKEFKINNIFFIPRSDMLQSIRNSEECVDIGQVYADFVETYVKKILTPEKASIYEYVINRRPVSTVLSELPLSSLPKFKKFYETDTAYLKMFKEAEMYRDFLNALYKVNRSYFTDDFGKKFVEDNLIVSQEEREKLCTEYPLLSEFPRTLRGMSKEYLTSVAGYVNFIIRRENKLIEKGKS